jgi:hypothetical protein
VNNGHAHSKTLNNSELPVIGIPLLMLVTVLDIHELLLLKVREWSMRRTAGN